MDIKFDVTHYQVQMFERNYLDVTERSELFINNVVISLLNAGWFVKFTELNGRTYLRYGA